mgnify:CR=1 FL=1
MDGAQYGLANEHIYSNEMGKLLKAEGLDASSSIIWRNKDDKKNAVSKWADPLARLPLPALSRRSGQPFDFLREWPTRCFACRLRAWRWRGNDGSKFLEFVGNSDGLELLRNAWAKPNDWDGCPRFESPCY